MAHTWSTRLYLRRDSFICVFESLISRLLFTSDFSFISATQYKDLRLDSFICVYESLISRLLYIRLHLHIGCPILNLRRNSLISAPLLYMGLLLCIGCPILNLRRDSFICVYESLISRLLFISDFSFISAARSKDLRRDSFICVYESLISPLLCIGLRLYIGCPILNLRRDSFISAPLLYIGLLLYIGCPILNLRRDSFICVNELLIFCLLFISGSRYEGEARYKWDARLHSCHEHIIRVCVYTHIYRAHRCVTLVRAVTHSYMCCSYVCVYTYIYRALFQAVTNVSHMQICTK